MRQLIVTFILSCITSMAMAQDNVNAFDLSPFPAPTKESVRHIIYPPAISQGNENDYKIEFYVGKYAEVDMCNNFGLMGELKSKEVKGYGYNYYTFETKGDIMGTLMGCSDRSTQTKFVTGQSTILRYNPRMPIIIYTPQGYSVKYRIFKAGDLEYTAEASQ